MCGRLRRQSSSGFSVVVGGVVDSDGGGSSGRGLDLLLEKLKTTQSNAEFLAEVAKAPSLGG